MTAEIEVAAARLRDHESGGDPYPFDCGAMQSGDERALAHAYLAEHPADEHEPLDDAFVRSNTHTLPTDGDGPFWHWLESGKPYHTVHVFLLCSEFGRWSACVSMPADADCIPWKEICELKTRGDVRRLCAALGIELKAA